MRLPIRARLALFTAALVAVVLAGGAVLLYVQFSASLLEVIDARLRARSEALIHGETIEGLVGDGTLGEFDEDFAQTLSSEGAVLESSPGLQGRPLLTAEQVRRFPAARFFQAEVRTVEEPVEARLLAVRTDGGRMIVVGSSLDDQKEALARLATLLAVGGPAALILVAAVGWVIGGAALRPVERMRKEAAAISASEPGRRLPVPATGDEVARLGRTLNDMLGRLEEALERERRFVDDASHELRTPLANLRPELERALRGARTAEDLEQVVRSAAEEAEGLARLAEDLLVLARADRGRLPVRPERVDLGELVGEVVQGFIPRADSKGVVIDSRGGHGLRADVDPVRIRQAVGNLLDNAVRHTPSGGHITVEVGHRDGFLSMAVADTGPGFASGFVSRAFEPFARPDAGRSRHEGGAGLGLAIVRAVAEAHGGVAEAVNRPEGGALVTLRIPV